MQTVRRFKREYRLISLTGIRCVPVRIVSVIAVSKSVTVSWNQRKHTQCTGYRNDLISSCAIANNTVVFTVKPRKIVELLLNRNTFGTQSIQKIGSI